MGSETLGQLLATCFPTKLCKEEPTLFSVFPFSIFFFQNFPSFACVHVYAPYVCLVPMEAKRGHWIPWDSSSRQL